MIDLTEPRKRNRLLISKIQSIGFVDKGACPGANVLVVKRDTQDDASGTELACEAAERRLLQLAGEIQKRESCDFEAAMTKVSRSHPELYDAYRCGAAETVGELRKRYRRGEKLGRASWGDTLADLAQERAELTGGNFTDALMQIAKERPALAEAYQHEVAGH